MKRFLIRLFVVALLVIVAQIGIYVMACFLKKGKIDAYYTLRDDQKFLFLGSSQMGCGIVESSEFENKVMWASATPLQISLVQFKELERRGQLKNVQALCLNLNCLSVVRSTGGNHLLNAYYRHLPITLRYVGENGVGWSDFIWSLVSSAHFPFVGISPNEIVPRPRCSQLLNHDKEFEEKLKRQVAESAQNWIKEYKRCRTPDDTLVSCLEDFKIVCDRNHIRLVVMELPQMGDYMVHLSKEGESAFKSLQNKVANKGIEVWLPKTAHGLDCFVDSLHQTESSALVLTKEIVSHLRRK